MTSFLTAKNESYHGIRRITDMLLSNNLIMRRKVFLLTPLYRRGYNLPASEVIPTQSKRALASPFLGPESGGQLDTKWAISSVG